MAKSIDYKAFGYDIYNTGGGCVAWRKGYETGCYALITDEDGGNLPDHDATHVSVGVYDEETGEELFGNAWQPVTAEQALEIADSFASDYVREE